MYFARASPFPLSSSTQDIVQVDAESSSKSTSPLIMKLGKLEKVFYSTIVRQQPIVMGSRVKCYFLRPPQTRKHCCGNTVAETLFPRRANGETFVEKPKCF